MKNIVSLIESISFRWYTTEDGTVEFRYARELMGCLGYTTWRRFKDAINRAMESCKSAEIEVSDHFADAVKMVEIGSNAVRDVDDIMLTRYACYLIAGKRHGRFHERKHLPHSRI